MANFSIRYIWPETYPHEFHYPDHTHDFYEMAYYTNGTGLLKADGKDYPLGNGYYAIVPPGMKHCETQHLNAEKVCIGIYCNEKLPFIYQKESSTKIHLIISEMLKERKNLKYNSWGLLGIKINEMFIYIDRDKYAKKKSSIANLEHIIVDMESRYHEKISLEEYAKQLNISYDYFRHKFKEVTGFSPQEYISNKKLDTAANMLTSSSLSCSEIADKCGFSNSAQFSKMFKEKYKISPNKYRKM